MKLSKKARQVVTVVLIMAMTAAIIVGVVFTLRKNQDTIDNIEKYAKECGLEEVVAKLNSGTIVLQCDGFQFLSDEDKYKTAKTMEEKLTCALSAGEISPYNDFVFSSGEKTYHDFTHSSYYMNEEYVQISYSDNYSSSNSGRSSSFSPSKSGKAKKTCPLCKGTGKVRYYVGGSALEAALNGYEDFYMGPCTSCSGTGYYYE